MGGFGEWAAFLLWMLSGGVRLYISWGHTRRGCRSWCDVPRFLVPSMSQLVLSLNGFFCSADALLRREWAANPTFCSAKTCQIPPIREYAAELLIAVLFCTHDPMREKMRRVYGISLWMTRSEFED